MKRISGTAAFRVDSTLMLNVTIAEAHPDTPRQPDLHDPVIVDSHDLDVPAVGAEPRSDALVQHAVDPLEVALAAVPKVDSLSLAIA